MSLREADARSALAREVELWEAFRRRDRAAIERLVDPLALDVGPHGARTRSELLDALANVELRSYTIDDLVARDGDGLAVAVYRSEVDGSYRGVAFEHPSVLVTSVWRAHGAAFVLVARSETPSSRR